MYSDIELKSFKLIDSFLKKLSDDGDGSFYDIDPNNQHSKECQFAYKIMCDKDLISFRKGFPDKNSIIDISSNGINILKLGGYTNYLDALILKSDKDEYIKNLEFEKTKTDLELAKRMLKEYPKTKWAARLGFIIASCLAILELVKFLKGQ